ncbi:NAD synthase [Dietzia psychralcaliphila]|uniref:NH(3)-dependent NAD(+) synthetase n=1 Tax=Dietzia psychralcaliphila TaxID=139021 RepID=A0AAD0JWJ7_9ACTN|nr:ammonia-dependent NAD(+) synthetase [Dietzia psychralcaliphila]AWH96766.1 NAD synthase [Dietzia psychralcaliphila]PTM89410.1 NAD+ synthetase [Dietzia psychralcaliphila]
MRETQRKIIDALGVRPEIDPADEVERRVRFLADYLTASGAKGFVLGISGGVDSSLAGRLSQLAAERVRSDGGDAVFVGMRLPYRVQHDEHDAVAALEFVAADESLTVDVAPGVDALNGEIRQATGEELTDFTKGNTKARHRMVTQYAVAGDRGLLVIGADHAAENVTGFFTKFGDGAADLLPLSGLDKRQVRALLRHLEAPQQLWDKVPTADLLDDAEGQTDEAELGIGYDAIDDYLEGREVPVRAAETIEAAWHGNRHKRTTPVEVTDTWWRPTGQPDEPTGEGTALVVIDMQNSYFEFPELAAVRDELVGSINELIRAAHDADRPVVLVRTEHAEDGSTWTLNMREDDQGFAFPGTEQARFLDGLATGGHVEVVKTRDSAFFKTSLRAELDRLGASRLLVCGVSTHSCVAQTAIDGFAENLHVAVARGAVSSDNSPLSEALLEFLHDQMRQPLLDQTQSLELLRTGHWPD